MISLSWSISYYVACEDFVPYDFEPYQKEPYENEKACWDAYYKMKRSEERLQADSITAYKIDVVERSLLSYSKP